MLTIDDIKNTIASIADEYQLTKVTLFGSRANGNFHEDSDVDLLVEFTTKSVSLLRIISLKNRLEDEWHLEVDVVHAPIPDKSMLVVEKEIAIYAA